MKFINQQKALRCLSLLAVLLLFVAGLHAQRVAVSGVVKDRTSSEPLYGVSVIEKGTTNGVMTAIDGRFSLSLASSSSVLVVSYLGYNPKEIPVESNTFFNILLEEDTRLLDEVVVIGYGAVKKKDATGSISAIKPDELNKGLNLNPQDALQGRVAGVNITSNDGAPGGGAQIRIRGGSSLKASNDPLIVIDGMPMSNESVKGVGNPLSVINPNDIESFTVLKDASATAIYGSRASNGVILITTKKGTVGSKPSFSYSGNLSASTLVKRLEVMSGDELRNYASQLKLSAENMKYLGQANTDWQNQIYRMGIGSDHNITMSGGLKSMPYRIGLGLTYQDGIIKTSNMHRGTLSGSFTPTFFDKHLSLNINFKAMYVGNRWADAGVVGAALAMDPTQPVYDTTFSEFGGYFQRPDNANFGDPSWKYKSNSQATANPLATLMHKNERSRSYQLLGNIDMQYKVHGFEDLSLHLNLAGEYGDGSQRNIIDRHSFSNNYYGWDETERKFKYTKTLSAYAHYSKDLSKKQSFDIMVGHEYQHYLREKGEKNGWGIYPDTYPDVSKRGQKFDPRHDAFGKQLFLASFFGRMNYSAFERYLLTLTFRTDGSSYFAPDRRWGLFPAAAFAWKINEETFLRDFKALSDLKLRLGWGITGQQELGLNEAPYLPVYDKNKEYAHYPVGDDSAGAYSYLGTYRPKAINRDITWEKTTTYNVGVDYAFLNGRISGSLDAYYRLTTDLINEVDIPNGTNFSNKAVANVGSLSNTGVEFAVNARAIDSKDFSWDISFNATYNQNRIENLTLSNDPNYHISLGGVSSGVGNTILVHKKGYPASSFFVYETQRDADGNFHFVDRFVDGQITGLDRYVHKSAQAPLFFGFSSTFNFRKWDLSLFMRSKLGNYVYNDYLSSSLRGVERTNIVSAKSGGFSNVSKAAYAVFYGEGFRSDKLNDWYLADYLVEDASFLRLDRATLGYNPNSKLRVYLTVQNPLVLTGYRGLDPEVIKDNVLGIDNNAYPRSMTTILGLTYNF